MAKDDEFKDDAPLPDDPEVPEAPDKGDDGQSKGSEQGKEEGKTGSDDDAVLSAFEAFAAADPEGAAEYLKFQEDKAAAVEAAAAKKDETPADAGASSLEDQALEERAQFKSFERQHRNDVEEINANYRADLAEWQGRARNLQEMKKEGTFNPEDPIHRQTEQQINQDGADLTKYHREVVAPKNAGVKMFKAIDEEVAEYPPLAPYRMVYANLRANGVLHGTETPAQIKAAINAELAKAGKPLFGQSAKTKAEQTAAQRERLKKLRSPNVQRSGDRGGARAGAAGGGGAGAGIKLKPTGDASLDAALREQMKG